MFTFIRSGLDLRTLGYEGPIICAPNGVVLDNDGWDGGSSGELLWLGRYDIEHKGLDILVDALARVPEESRPRVALYGKDARGEMVTLQRRAEAAGVADWMRIAPAIYGEQKRSALRTATGFVFPSRWDSSSLAVAEAAGVGLPLIVSDSTYIGPFLAAAGAAISVAAAPEPLARGSRSDDFGRGDENRRAIA